MGILAVQLSGSDGEEPASTVDEPITRAGEVFLQPALSTGPEPFIAETERVTSVTPVAFAPRLPVTEAADHNEVTETTATVGTDPGLYGGTQDNARCDVEQIIAFLEENQEKASAWGAVHDLAADEVPGYLRGLTPVVLLEDVRVTNHGFRGGRATAFQATLERGTAVLIDDTGMPRARCACGNPLTDPIAQTTVVFVGDPWDGFDPDDVAVITPGDPVDEFVLQDVEDGDAFTRPAGSDGSEDVEAPADVALAVEPIDLAGSTEETATATTTTEPAPESSQDVTVDGPASEAEAILSYCNIIGTLTGDTTLSEDAIFDVYEAAGMDVDFIRSLPRGEDADVSDEELARFFDELFEGIAALAPPEIADDARILADSFDPATFDLFDFLGDQPPLDPAVQAASDRIEAFNEATCGSPTEPETAVVDVTATGELAVSSTFSDDFLPALAVDRDPTTSWFAAGPGTDGDASTLTWTVAEDLLISRILIVGNAAHPNFPTGFGFETVTIELRNAAGELVASQSFDLGGTPDPDVEFEPGVTASEVRLVFSQHESAECGGFAELIVEATVPA